MQIYYIRHGQSTNNELWERDLLPTGRSQDPELTEIGHRQAQHVAQYLSHQETPSHVARYDPKNVTGFDITHLYCSPMIRAFHTAAYIAQALELPLVVCKDLHELGGIYLDDPVSGEPVGLAGKPRSYFLEYYPNIVLPDELKDDGWWNRPFEERSERPERAARVLACLVSLHGGTKDRVALVSHAGLYTHLMRQIVSASERDDLHFVLDNVGITRINFEDDSTIVVYTNRTDFLPDHLHT